MPKLSQIKHEGNSSLFISNLNEINFKMKISGNGTNKILGFVENLEIEQTGNSTTFAKELNANNAKLISTGNGNSYVNISNKITAQASGNSSIKNFGNAKFDNRSSRSGNATLINN